LRTTAAKKPRPCTSYSPELIICRKHRVGMLAGRDPTAWPQNVGAKYPFERSHRFAGIQPDSSHRDYLRLSCAVGETQLGRVARLCSWFWPGKDGKPSAGSRSGGRSQ
jgi:hypothetical protein